MSVDLKQLRNLLSAHIGLADLKELTFDLGIDYEELAGGSKTIKILELITYLERRGRLGELIGELKDKRPDVEWSTVEQP